MTIREEPGGGGREGSLSSSEGLTSESRGSSLRGEALAIGAQDRGEERRELARGDRAEENARGGAYGKERSRGHEKRREEEREALRPP